MEQAMEVIKLRSLYGKSGTSIPLERPPFLHMELRQADSVNSMDSLTK